MTLPSPRVVFSIHPRAASSDTAATGVLPFWFSEHRAATGQDNHKPMGQKYAAMMDDGDRVRMRGSMFGHLHFRQPERK